MTKVVEDIKANGPEVYKPTCACEYVNMSLTKAASTTFANKAENKPILDFIKNYTLPTAVVNKSLAFYMDESDGDMVATAKNFLSNNNMWEKWVPGDVAKKVKAAL
jgi:glycine betaine/proline transport system substrate-binding protein